MKEIKCGWCQKVIPAPQVKVKHYRNEFGSVTERRCPHCSNVIAAYLEEEKVFLPKIRTF